MAKIIAVANQKGGVGKTTTTVNLAACLAAMAYRTLLIDLDPQGNATSGVGVERDELEHSVYDLFCGDKTAAEVIVTTHVDGLDLLPSRTDLASAEIELVAEPRRQRKLRDALAPVRDNYDYILIDCPPSLTLLTINALVGADSVLVPVQAEYYALEGLARLLDTIEAVKGQLNRKLEVEGMLLTMVDARNNLAKQVEEEVREHFADKTYKTVIPRNVRLSESPSFGEPIIMYDIGSNGAKSYLSLAREFIERNTATV
ncbi:MAG: chromosome partitioning protein [Bradymonadia bacterium]|jgi:chromosome partitioning protein